MYLPNSNFTPADKRVWLWKLATTAASILVFTVSYIFTDNINSAAASVAVTVAVAFTFTLEVALTLTTAFAFSDAFMFGVAVATAVASTAAVAVAKVNLKVYTNIISCLFQFVFTWAGFN